MNTEKASLHSQLKQQTQDLHEAIEKDSLMHQLMSPTLTREEYILLLERMLHFYNDVESQLAQLPVFTLVFPILTTPQNVFNFKRFKDFEIPIAF